MKRIPPVWEMQVDTMDLQVELMYNQLKDVDRCWMASRYLEHLRVDITMGRGNFAPPDVMAILDILAGYATFKDGKLDYKEV